MQNDKLREHHLKSFSKLTLSERLSWAFARHQFLTRFMDKEAKQINKNMRKNGKKYFHLSDVDLADINSIEEAKKYKKKP